MEEAPSEGGVSMSNVTTSGREDIVSTVASCADENDVPPSLSATDLNATDPVRTKPGTSPSEKKYRIRAYELEIKDLKEQLNRARKETMAERKAKKDVHKELEYQRHENVGLRKAIEEPQKLKQEVLLAIRKEKDSSKRLEQCERALRKARNENEQISWRLQEFEAALEAETSAHGETMAELHAMRTQNETLTAEYSQEPYESKASVAKTPGMGGRPPLIPEQSTPVQPNSSSMSVGSQAGELEQKDREIAQLRLNTHMIRKNLETKIKELEAEKSSMTEALQNTTHVQASKDTELINDLNAALWKAKSALVACKTEIEDLKEERERALEEVLRETGLRRSAEEKYGLMETKLTELSTLLGQERSKMGALQSDLKETERRANAGEMRLKEVIERYQSETRQKGDAVGQSHAEMERMQREISALRVELSQERLGRSENSRTQEQLRAVGAQLAAMTKRYKDAKDMCGERDKRIATMVREMNGGKDRWSDERDAMNEKLANMKTTETLMQSKIQGLKEKVDSCERELHKKDEKIHSLENNITESRAEINSLQERMKNMKKEYTTMGKELKSKDSEFEAERKNILYHRMDIESARMWFQSETSDMVAMVADAMKHVDDLEWELHMVEQRLQDVMAERDAAVLNYEDMRSRVSEIENESKQELEEKSQKLEETSAKVWEIEQQVGELVAALGIAEKEVARRDEELARITEEHAAQTERMAVLTEEQHVAQVELNHAETRMSDLVAERDKMKDLVEEIRGEAKEKEVYYNEQEETYKQRLAVLKKSNRVSGLARAQQEKIMCLALMKHGVVVTKYSYKKGKPQERWLVLSEDERTISWGKASKKAEHHHALVSDITGLYYGAKTPSFYKWRKQGDTSKDGTKPLCFWACMTIEFKTRTLDVMVTAEDTVFVWLLGLQHLIGSNTRHVLKTKKHSRGALLWKRAVLRIQARADARGQRYARVIAQAISQSAGAKALTA